MPARAVIPGVPDEAQDRAWEAIDGAILRAGRRARNHNQKLSRKNVLLHMARIDSRALHWFQEAYQGPGGRHAQAVHISLVLEPEKFSRRVESERQQARTEKARADALEAATYVGVPEKVRYGDVLDVLSVEDSDSSPSWVKWAGRLIGAPFVTIAAVTYFFEPRLGVVLLPVFSAFWVGMLLWERRDYRKAQRRRPLRVQFGLPTKPGIAYRRIVDRADGRTVVDGEYELTAIGYLMPPPG